jgi:LysR family hydrogen peroxide-inducible transcriptional activator
MKLLPSLKQLEYLTALAETGHFGHAAARCNVTPSTLSAGIRELEGVLGVTLAERTKRKVLMTPLGRDIAGRADALLRDAEEIMALARVAQDPLAGDMRLGVIPTVAPYLLPDVLPRLHEAFPALRLYLREDKTAELLERLGAGELDVALIALPFETGELVERPLFDDAFLFACPAGHRLAGRKRVTDADLEGEALLLLEEGHCLRGHALDACRLAAPETRHEFEATSLITLVQMVAAGLGVTLLPKLAVDAGIAKGSSIRVIALAEPAKRRIGLVWRKASARAEAFERLAEMFAGTVRRKAAGA